MSDSFRVTLIKNSFEYREDGNLIWKNILEKNNRYLLGKVAGSLNIRANCIYVGFLGRRWKLHHLIWLYHKGEPLPLEIDHEDKNPFNNKIKNLRSCTRSQNLANQKISRSNNTSGFRGVSKQGNSWRAVISHNGNFIHIGTFLSKQLAAEAYDDKAIELFGEFSSLNFPIKEV